jgi:GntR family transcriptional regulator/MocR family aminotransferase
MHAVWHLPDGTPPAPELQRRLANVGVGVYSLAAAPVHLVEPVSACDLVLLLGYPCLSEERIRSAVERIARVLDRSGDKQDEKPQTPVSSATASRLRIMRSPIRS